MVRYTNEFKATIVEVYNGGKTLSKLSREYDISKSTISVWVKKAKPVAINDSKSIIQADYNKLIKKMQQLEEENEILKKAMVIFTNN